MCCFLLDNNFSSLSKMLAFILWANLIPKSTYHCMWYVLCHLRDIKSIKALKTHNENLEMLTASFFTLIILNNMYIIQHIWLNIQLKTKPVWILRIVSGFYVNMQWQCTTTCQLDFLVCGLWSVLHYFSMFLTNVSVSSVKVNSELDTDQNICCFMFLCPFTCLTCMLVSSMVNFVNKLIDLLKIGFDRFTAKIQLAHWRGNTKQPQILHDKL